ncbi:MAG: aminoglycoside phosphotransferase family protein [Eudoraea sp.]|nr:aminoglycoside phosphotransferase family protein [Eudoraea sp.]NNJ41442.1 aminoglycoside phosphotransferase family protein [Eudoraea sp.]
MGNEEIKAVLQNFPVPVDHIVIKPLSQGYINRSFVIAYKDSPDFLLQQINTKVFADVEALMANMVRALPHLKAPNYTGPELVYTKNGTSYLQTRNGGCWRLMTYVPDSASYLYCKDLKTAGEAGRILGLFHNLMSKARPTEYLEFIPGFHSLELRKRQFDLAREEATPARKRKAKKAIAYAQNTAESLLSWQDVSVPLRVCHNDTKMSNILFSKKEGKALCLVDLDTLMPGYFHCDFGDALRTVVNPAPEDEKNLDKISFNRAYCEAFVSGLSSVGPLLSRQEIEHLPFGAQLMPFLHGLRALTDFLMGDVYYQVSYPDQNLDRSLSLFRFAALAKEETPYLKEVIQKYLG